jgi:hypothetical protein
MKRMAIALAAALVSGLVALGSDADKPKPPPDLLPTGDKQVAAIVAYFAKNGIKLKGGVVIDPKSEGYKVVVRFKAFPEGTTEAQMRDHLAMINLAYMLNVPARVAMSYPSLESTDPNVKLPKLDELPVAKKLQRLFAEYRPMPELDKAR